MTELAVPQSTPTSFVARQARSHFFVGASVVMFLIVLVGFSPTFYLRGLLPARPIPTYVYLHGIVMTAWYAIFVTQTSLVAAGRRALHRRLGIGGVMVAVAVSVLGLYTNQNLLSRLQAAGIAVSPQVETFVHAVTVTGLFLLGAFAFFVTVAIFLRHRPEAHRRLMYLALLATLPPALGPGRWIGKAFAQFLPPWPGLINFVTWAFLLALVLHDWSSRRRIHPATLWGGLLLVALELTSNAMTGNGVAAGAAVR